MSRLIGFFGGLLILAGLFIFGLTFYPVLWQEFEYQTGQLSFQEYQVVEDLQEAETVKKQPSLSYRKKIFVPQSFEFSLVIPKIGVNARVFPNIDSGHEEEYLPILREGVAHAQGSALPNQIGPVFIFAHSTGNFYTISHYNAVFFLLRKLEAGDEAYLFYQNRKYLYQVERKLITEPEKVNEEVQKLTDHYLVLQTCYPPGTTLRRLLVVAKMVD